MQFSVLWSARRLVSTTIIASKRWESMEMKVYKPQASSSSITTSREAITPRQFSNQSTWFNRNIIPKSLRVISPALSSHSCQSHHVILRRCPRHDACRHWPSVHPRSRRGELGERAIYDQDPDPLGRRRACREHATRPRRGRAPRNSLHRPRLLCSYGWAG